MEMPEKKKEGLKILGLCILGAALLVGIVGVFEFMENWIAPPAHAPVAVLKTGAGQDSRYTLRIDTATQDEAEAQWLSRAQKDDAQDGAPWLLRQAEEEALAYLPMQDIALGSGDITATEERDADGSDVLVLRIRTPEGGEAVQPQAQLLRLACREDGWQGLRVRVILDGRELAVQRTILTGSGELFSSDGV